MRQLLKNLNLTWQCKIVLFDGPPLFYKLSTFKVDVLVKQNISVEVETSSMETDDISDDQNQDYEELTARVSELLSR